jgi:hypothetical protein
MNRDPLARAIAAACITIALLASGMLLARGALSAPPLQSLHPDEFLPLIMQPRGSPTASPTTTASASPTTTATATATASPTTTATATATTVPTLVPTSDPLATAQLEIGNLTGFSLSFTLNISPEGTLAASGDIAPRTVKLLTIRPGEYVLAATTQCRYTEVPLTLITNQDRRVDFVCP